MQQKNKDGTVTYNINIICWNIIGLYMSATASDVLVEEIFYSSAVQADTKFN